MTTTSTGVHHQNGTTMEKHLVLNERESVKKDGKVVREGYRFAYPCPTVSPGDWSPRKGESDADFGHRVRVQITAIGAEFSTLKRENKWVQTTKGNDGSPIVPSTYRQRMDEVPTVTRHPRREGSEGQTVLYGFEAILDNGLSLAATGKWDRLLGNKSLNLEDRQIRAGDVLRGLPDDNPLKIQYEAYIAPFVAARNFTPITQWINTHAEEILAEVGESEEAV